jgi:hypothetical protein
MTEFEHVATDDTGYEDREDAEVSIAEHLREVGAS